MERVGSLGADPRRNEEELLRPEWNPRTSGAHRCKLLPSRRQFCRSKSRHFETGGLGSVHDAGDWIDGQLTWIAASSGTQGREDGRARLAPHQWHLVFGTAQSARHVDERAV